MAMLIVPLIISVYCWSQPPERESYRKIQHAFHNRLFKCTTVPPIASRRLSLLLTARAAVKRLISQYLSCSAWWMHHTSKYRSLETNHSRIWQRPCCCCCCCGGIAMIECSMYSLVKGDPFATVASGILQIKCGSFPQCFLNNKSVSEKGFSRRRIIMMMEFILSLKFSLSLLSLFLYACGPLWWRAIGKSLWSSLEISFRAFVWEGKRKRKGNKGEKLGREEDRGGDTERRPRSEEWEQIKLWAHLTQKNWSCYECV